MEVSIRFSHPIPIVQRTSSPTPRYFAYGPRKGYHERITAPWVMKELKEQWLWLQLPAHREDKRIFAPARVKSFCAHKYWDLPPQWTRGLRSILWEWKRVNDWINDIEGVGLMNLQNPLRKIHNWLRASMLEVDDDFLVWSFIIKVETKYFFLWNGMIRPIFDTFLYESDRSEGLSIWTSILP